MAHPFNYLDERVQSAIIRVCEDLTLDIPTIVQEIVDEFDNANADVIVAELTEAREVQIAENKIADRLYVEAE